MRYSTFHSNLCIRINYRSIWILFYFIFYHFDVFYPKKLQRGAVHVLFCFVFCAADFRSILRISTNKYIKLEILLKFRLHLWTHWTCGHVASILLLYSFFVTFCLLRWTVPDTGDVEQGRQYKIAVWDETSGVCAISHNFGISVPQVFLFFIPIFCCPVLSVCSCLSSVNVDEGAIGICIKAKTEREHSQQL